MFNIGDKVVYPNQGVGVVEFIEQRIFKGIKQDFYKISIINSTMELVLPVSRAEVANVRLVSSENAIDNSLQHIHDFITDETTLKESTSKERMATNAVKIKTGDFKELLSVIGDLSHIKHINKLNTNEQQVLDNTKSFIANEISQAKDLSKDEALNLLNKAINS